MMATAAKIEDIVTRYSMITNNISRMIALWKFLTSASALEQESPAYSVDPRFHLYSNAKLHYKGDFSLADNIVLIAHDGCNLKISQ